MLSETRRQTQAVAVHSACRSLSEYFSAVSRNAASVRHTCRMSLCCLIARSLSRFIEVELQRQRASIFFR
jgi:hypothetical protein